MPSSFRGWSAGHLNSQEVQEKSCSFSVFIVYSCKDDVRSPSCLHGGALHRRSCLLCLPLSVDLGAHGGETVACVLHAQSSYPGPGVPQPALRPCPTATPVRHGSSESFFSLNSQVQGQSQQEAPICNNLHPHWA